MTYYSKQRINKILKLGIFKAKCTRDFRFKVDSKRPMLSSQYTAYKVGRSGKYYLFINSYGIGKRDVFWFRLSRSERASLRKRPKKRRNGRGLSGWSKPAFLAGSFDDAIEIHSYPLSFEEVMSNIDHRSSIKILMNLDLFTDE